MIELQEDLWSSSFEWRAITTNGIVKRDGTLVMGAGTALQAAERFPVLPKVLGDQVSRYGNVPFIVDGWGTLADCKLVTFPTKYHWRDKANLLLIQRSAQKIRAMWDARGNGPVAIPRPGCANGGLTWDEVRPVLEPIFDDDRFIIVHSKYDVSVA